MCVAEKGAKIVFSFIIEIDPSYIKINIFIWNKDIKTKICQRLPRGRGKLFS
jgi:hypothetical protein